MAKVKKLVALIDYRYGNTKSVYDALKELKIKTKLCKKSNDFKNCTHIILPGVGSFDKCINDLKKKKLFDELKKQITIKKKKYLGICVGFQILCTDGVENKITSGLNLIDGRCEKFPKKSITPHIGWNSVNFNRKMKLFKNIKQNSYFYFLHSYCISKTKTKLYKSKTHYFKNFISTIEKDNLFGVQFHPEKSQENGLKLIKNFVNL